MTITPRELEEMRGSDAIVARLRMDLNLAAIRLEICLGRMRACAQEHPLAHAVSLGELPHWIEETRQAARP